MNCIFRIVLKMQNYFKDVVLNEFSTTCNYKGKLLEYQQRFHLELPKIETNQIQKSFQSTVKLSTVDGNEIVVNGSKEMSKKILSEQFVCFEAINKLCSMELPTQTPSKVTNGSTADSPKVPPNVMVINGSVLIAENSNTSFIDSANYKNILQERQQINHLPLPTFSDTQLTNGKFISKVSFNVTTENAIEIALEESESRGTKKSAQQLASYKALMTLVGMTENNISAINNKTKKQNNIKPSYSKPLIRRPPKQLVGADRVDPLTVMTKDRALNLHDIYSKAVTFYPRPSQMDVFLHMISINTIVIMPTGSGKTLPASLAMARYRRCNPKKISVMVVDRIPLVKQQAIAISQFTGLKMCTLSSESNTRQIWHTIRENESDGIVATAGALNVAIEHGEFSYNDISILIFDECHHVIKNHMYAEIINRINSLPEIKQPRLIGLSASPSSGQDIQNVVAKLDKMKMLFGRSIIFIPSLEYEGTNKDILWMKAIRSIDQTNRNIDLLERLLLLYQQIPTAFLDQSFGKIDEFIKACQISLKVYLNNSLEKTFEDSEERRNESILKYIESDENESDSYQSSKTSLQSKSFCMLFDKVKGIMKYISRLLQSTNDKILSDEINDCLDRIEDNEYLGFDLYNDRPINVIQSTMLTLLVNEIDNHISLSNTLPKIILFVQEVRLAENLSEYLKFRYTYLNCDMITGHTSNVKGMTIPKQRETIRQFNEGIIHLIISTSVLEEGLDVQGCNLVIRYGPKGSLIQFLQSRGRARSKDGKMIVLLYDDEYDTMNKITNEEIILREAVHLISHRSPFP